MKVMYRCKVCGDTFFKIIKNEETGYISNLKCIECGGQDFEMKYE